MEQDTRQSQLYGAADITKDAVRSFAIWCDVLTDRDEEPNELLEQVKAKAHEAADAMSEAHKLLSR